MSSARRGGEKESQNLLNLTPCGLLASEWSQMPLLNKARRICFVFLFQRFPDEVQDSRVEFCTRGNVDRLHRRKNENKRAQYYAVACWRKSDLIRLMMLLSRLCSVRCSEKTRLFRERNRERPLTVRFFSVLVAEILQSSFPFFGSREKNCQRV